MHLGLFTGSHFLGRCPVVLQTLQPDVHKQSCLDSPVRSGFGGIIRNTFGHYLANFSSFIQGSSDILLAKLYAIYKGLLLAKDIGYEVTTTISND
ncbi:replication A1-like protein [Trifolium pratense]|uniref:Replication A1-like protein n=1 Tax=Trifolium pratense TaxID=57577 RepID=A0A2K3NVS3_TRIPR|nr:replication A1-like protein [Trifolium pratense]